MNDFRYPAGATPLESEEIKDLKIGHITTLEELNRFEQDAINEALQWLQVRRKGDVLTERFIKILHKKMFGKVWHWAGTYRRSGKNIGVDWTQIPVHLHILLQDVRYWIDHKTYPPDETAARFHHRLIWIHLFPNGNGRHARLMTDILLQDILKEKPFTWTMENAGDGDAIRTFYLKALRVADQGDYSILLQFVRSI